MSGLLSALNAGKTSLLTNQKSIEIVGNNVANVNTPGYSRQRAELMQIPAVNFGDFFVGQGVTVSDVQREHDLFITRQLQEKAVSLGEESGRSTPLAELERIFKIDDDAISAELDRFFDAWQKLAANPSGLVERDMVIQRGQLLGDVFRDTADEMDTVRRNINHDLLGQVETLNEKIAEVARLNDRIHLVEISGQSDNAARDRRDLLIEELSQSLGVKTYLDGENMLSVILPGGLPLVQGNRAMTLVADTTGTDVQLQLDISGNITDIHLEDIAGEIHGKLAMRDEFIASLRQDLDRLALDISEAVNSLHVAGYGSDGVTGRAFFVDLGGVADNAARNLQVAITDAAEVVRILKDNGAPQSELRLVIDTAAGA